MRPRVSVVGLALVISVIFGGALATAAQGSHLVLKSGGSPVAVESPGVIRQQVEISNGGSPVFCIFWGEGVLAKNGSGTDILRSIVRLDPYTACLDEEGNEVAGFSITNGPVEAKASGKQRITDKESPKMKISEPGPCVYHFGTIKAQPFTGPSFVEATGTVTGSREKMESDPSCEKKQTDAVNISLWGTPFGPMWEYEIV